MKIGIDATNIKAGGGLVHLKKILENNPPSDIEISVVGGNWLDVISHKIWLTKVIFLKPFASLLTQEFFKRTRLPKILNKTDIIFVPGGTFRTKKRPYVSMSQNMLVFEKDERDRFPISFNWLRYIILERLQLRSFENAAGIIFISNYAKNYILSKYPKLASIKSTVIYHGISNEFRAKPKTQNRIETYSEAMPFKLLYVSIINFYKHQWNVIEAVKRLRSENFPIQLDLIGPMYEPARMRFQESIEGSEDFINYIGRVDYDQISAKYKEADLFVFASSCENMPNILVEAMSAGLPILCSSFGPMPEILKDGGDYMDPTNVDSIYFGIKKLLNDPNRREEIAKKAYQIAEAFAWEKSAQETFDFIEYIYRSNREENRVNYQ